MFAQKRLMLALLGLVTGISAICSTYQEAEAAGPVLTRAMCNTRGRAGFMGKSMGERNAARLVQSVWARLGQTCNQLDRLAQIITEMPLQRPSQGGEFAACFYMGYFDGMYNAIDVAFDRCGQACFNAGAEIGNISAQGYCAASMAVGGLLDPGFIAQPPLPFCGSALVMGCKSEYVYTATVAIPACVPYTEGWFTETFDNTVRQDCFVPYDIPIRVRGRFTMNLGTSPIDKFLI